MPKKRSYTAKANQGKFIQTAIHNYGVNRQRKKRDAEASAQQKSRERARADRERERSIRRLELEQQRETARKKRENEKVQAQKQRLRLKEKEREDRMNKKREEKILALSARAKLEFEKLGLYSKGKTTISLAEKAEEAKLSASQIKKYLIDGKEQSISKETARCLLVDHFGAHVEKLNSYDKSHAVLSDERPQEISQLKHFQVFKDLRVESEVFVKEEKNRIKTEKEELRKSRSRIAFIEHCRKHHSIFEDRVEIIANLAEERNLDDKGIKASEEFMGYLNERDEYVKSIEERIKPFSLLK